MRILAPLIAAMLVSAAAQAAEWSVSKSTQSLTVMMGSPPPANALRVTDAPTDTWLYEQTGRVFLTVAAPKAMTRYLTYDLGSYERWEIAEEDDFTGAMLRVLIDGKTRLVTLDFSRVQDKKTLKIVTE